MTSKERFWKAVHLEEPDRVPGSPYIVFFAASLADMTPAESGWSVEKSHQALFKTNQYFDKEIDALNIQSMRFAYMDVSPLHIASSTSIGNLERLDSILRSVGWPPFIVVQ